MNISYVVIVKTIVLLSTMGERSNAEVIIVHPRVKEHGFQLHVNCKPRPVIQDISPVYKKVWPRNIELFHCAGTVDLTKNKKCVPTKKTEVHVNFKDFDVEDLKTNKGYFNHTHCAVKCVCTLNSVCQNEPLADIEETWCPHSHTWNTKTCECDAPANQKKSRKYDNCSENLNINVLVCALVGQFLLFVVAQFIIQKYKWFNCFGNSDVDKETDV